MGHKDKEKIPPLERSTTSDLLKRFDEEGFDVAAYANEREYKLVLHHSEFDGRSLPRVQSGQPMHRRMTNDAPEKVPCDAQR